MSLNVGMSRACGLSYCIFLSYAKEFYLVSAVGCSRWVGSLHVSKRGYVFLLGRGAPSQVKVIPEIRPPIPATQLRSRSVYRSLGTFISKTPSRTQSQTGNVRDTISACRSSLEAMYRCEFTPVPPSELTPRCFLFLFSSLPFSLSGGTIGHRWRANRICPTCGAV